MTDEKPNTLGAGNNGVDAFDKISEQHRTETADTVKNRGGRPRNDGLRAGSPEAMAADRRGGPKPAPRSGRPASPTMPAAEVFKPESVRILVRLPFDVAAAATKSDAWPLTPNEESNLAVTGAMALNEWFPQASPKWAALTAFSLALMSVAGSKYIVWREEKLQMAEALKKAREVEGGAK